MLTNDNVSKAMSLAGLIGVTVLLIFIVFQRFEERDRRLAQLDEGNLKTEITDVQAQTQALRQAAQLNPVWKNWAQAKQIANTYGLDLMTSQGTGRPKDNTWVGTLRGDSLTVLAVAKRIQSKVAAEIINYHHLGESSTLEIAVLGTDY